MKIMAKSGHPEQFILPIEDRYERLDHPTESIFYVPPTANVERTSETKTEHEPQSHIWSNSNIFAHLNDYQPSLAEESILLRKNDLAIKGTATENIIDGLEAHEISEMGLRELEKLNLLLNEDSNFMASDQNSQEFLDYLTDVFNPNAPSTETIVPDLNNNDIVIQSLDAKPQTTDELTKYQCKNCDQIFSSDEFEEHICDYDEDKIFIKDEEPIELVDVCEVTEKLHPSISLLNGNNLRIRKFLKDQMKIELKPTGQKTVSVVKIKPGGGPHSCPVCDRKFVHASGLTRHMEKHDQDTSINNVNSRIELSMQQKLVPLNVSVKCLVCFRIFNNSNNAFEHILKDHRRIKRSDDDLLEEDDVNDCSEGSDADELQKPEECSIVSTTSCTSTALPIIDFIRPCIISSVLQCEFCDYSFVDMTALLKHSASHDPRLGYECTLCSIRVPTIKDIVIHRQTECVYNLHDLSHNLNVQVYYACNVCEIKLETLEQLYEHRYTEIHLFPRHSDTSGRFEIPCEVCSFFYDTARQLIDHHSERHVKKYRYGGNGVGTGGFVSGTTSTGNSKYRQYLCDVCGKSYTQSSHLWQHLRFHKGVKPFACSEPNCTRRFTIRPDLNDHIRKCHTGERPYHCLICGKRFLTGSVFYQHRLIHRGERRYGCEECGKRFYRADALKNHSRIHTGEKPYPCTECAKSFRQRGDRDKHLRARHTPTTAPKLKQIDNFAELMPPTQIVLPKIRKNAAIQKPKELTKKARARRQNPNVVYIGDMPFPKSMFRPVLHDIDANIQ